MPQLSEARAAALGASVSDIFNQELKLDQNQALKVASIVSGDPNFNRRPDYYINIFNISPLEFIRHRPVDFPTIRIAGCPKGQPWTLAVRVPNIINYKWVSAETGQPAFSSIRGERFATDLLNPANLGENIWLDSVAGEMDQMHGSSDDLTRRGVFWEIRHRANGYCEYCDGPSFCPNHDVPSPENLSRAKAKMERHYRTLVDAAEKLASDMKTIGEIGAEHHLAADYLHINSTWHRRTLVQESCPNCGEAINPGIAYHASSVGSVCVLDWKRAVAAGVKKQEDVPLEARWWQEEAEPEKRGPGRPRKVVEGE